MTTNNPATVGDIARIEYHGEPVLTTAQLAAAYETTENNIKGNFRNNADRFIEGVHYFKVEGAELDVLRDKIFTPQISPKTRTLHLWTKRGALRHCKSVGTDRAWEVFELLEDTYFNHVAARDKPLPSIDNYKRAAMLTRLAAHAEDPYMKKRLVVLATNLLMGEEIFNMSSTQPTVQLSLFAEVDSAK